MILHSPQPVNREQNVPPAMPGACLCFRELILAYHAKGTFKIFGNIFPLGARGDTTFRITYSLIILPAANITYIFHRVDLLLIASVSEIVFVFLYGFILAAKPLSFCDILTEKSIYFKPAVQ